MNSLLIVVLLWAVVYISTLGSSELHGEEGKRVLPAVQMLESGNYLVPSIGGRPYLSKPPLVNWLVAASFRLFGVRNEWTARLPSTIFVLAVALALLTIGRVSLGALGSRVAAVCWLTSLGLVDKGRTIEIDAIYASLFALALIFWLIWWPQNQSPCLTFVVPWIFLGLGLLAKGPAHLFFFYVLVFAVLWRNDRLFELVRPAHLGGVLLMLGIFAGWAVPYFLEVRSHAPFQIWWHEVAAAFRGEAGRSENWALNFPRGIAYFLPWVLLLPFVRFNKIEDPTQREIARCLAWGTFVPFVIVLLIPGTLPRYIVPLAAPVCWLIGIACANDAFEWRLAIKNLRIQFSRRMVGSTVVIAVLAEMVIFPLRSATFLKRHERIKPIAAQINAALPPGEPLYAIDPLFQPYLFYVRAPVIYLETLDELPTNARNFLIQSRDLEKVQTSTRWSTLRPRLVARTPSYRTRDTMLFAVTANQSNQ